MSFLSPGKSEVQSSMQAVARYLKDKAEALETYASGFEEMTEEEFTKHLGDEFTGAGWMRQMMEQVASATTSRPSDTAEFERRLTEAFARAQREVAALAAAEKAGA